jgi:hypothetical protein
MRAPTEGNVMSATQLIRFEEARRALGVACNRTLKAACERHGIAVVELSCRTKGLKQSDYDLLLARASGLETV